ncbi:MAG: LysR family transcriptional regulator [Alphaproteobacteria bacterium]
MIRNIDTSLLRAFLAIYEAGSFSHAAERLGRTQSTVSQQIKKLEDILGKEVFLRSNRAVSLTTEGEILLSYARTMVAMNDEVLGRISKPDISGAVKLGAPDAFAAHHLSNILVQFKKSHPSVGLTVRCDVSRYLIEDFQRGHLDIILIKRDKKVKIYGNKVWYESLVWVGQGQERFNIGDTVPLIISPSPCVYRGKMIDALDKKKFNWHAVFTSSNMTSRIAAAQAGLGVTVIPKGMLSNIGGLFSLGAHSGLPALSNIEIDLVLNEERCSDAALRLAKHIVFALESNPALRKKKKRAVSRS